tara:strand:- start:2257 stop:2694 length:438 start_codon:yes stop_codon:yes gene_type:complete
MKYLVTLLCLLFVPLSANADRPERKVIKPPQVVRSQPREFTRPPAAKPVQNKPLPKGFGVPIQRPQGFGKQQWQKPQPQPQQPKVQTKHSFGFYNYYRPVNPHFRYYRVPSYYPPVIIQPPVVIQPQPMPIYPGPFHGFFFQFRF